MAKFTWTPESVVELHADSSVHPIHGEIRNLRGEANVDVADGNVNPNGATGYIEADVEQLGTGKKLEDIALRKQIDAKKFPTVRYEVKEVTGGPDTYNVRGELTFHGVTKEFNTEVRAKVDSGTLYAEGELSLDIRDFGVQPPKILNLQVYPDIRVVARLVGKEQGGAW